MGVSYRMVKDNVGFEIFDTVTGRRVRPELVFSRQEAADIVKSYKIRQRGAPKPKKKRNKKRKVIMLRR
jgi:hypothetical protein